MSTENYLSKEFPVFSERATWAAPRGLLNAAPLVHLIERANLVALGVSAVLRLNCANAVLAENDRLANDLPAPLNANQMGSLLDLARVACEMLYREIEEVAERTNGQAATHGAKGNGEARP